MALSFCWIGDSFGVASKIIFETTFVRARSYARSCGPSAIAALHSRARLRAAILALGSVFRRRTVSAFLKILENDASLVANHPRRHPYVRRPIAFVATDLQPLFGNVEPRGSLFRSEQFVRIACACGNQLIGASIEMMLPTVIGFGFQGRLQVRERSTHRVQTVSLFQRCSFRMEVPSGPPAAGTSSSFVGRASCRGLLRTYALSPPGHPGGTPWEALIGSTKLAGYYMITIPTRSDCNLVLILKHLPHNVNLLAHKKIYLIRETFLSQRLPHLAQLLDLISDALHRIAQSLDSASECSRWSRPVPGNGSLAPAAQ